jgi:hypothetical protein
MSLFQPQEILIGAAEILGWAIFSKLDRRSNSDLKNLLRIINFIEEGYIFNASSLSSIVKKGTQKLASNSMDFFETDLGIRFKGLVEGFVDSPQFISNYLGPKAQLILSKIVIGKILIRTHLFGRSRNEG